MARVQLVAESFEEYKSPKTESLNEEQLNENSKKSLQKFLKNPEKYEKSFYNAYSQQLGKQPTGPKIKKALAQEDIETKKKLAQQSFKALKEDPKKGYAWLQIKDGKIVGAGALGVKKADVGSELGQ